MTQAIMDNVDNVMYKDRNEIRNNAGLDDWLVIYAFDSTMEIGGLLLDREQITHMYQFLGEWLDKDG